MQYYSPNAEKTYETWIRQKLTAAKKSGDLETLGRAKYDVEPLDDGKASLLWLGDRQKAKKVVLFFHGGGYISPMTPGHVEWCWQAYVKAGIEAKVETAVAVLQYTLAPGGKYPTQLRQAANGLSHLLSAGFRPADIVIGGDSAGGNLTDVLLHHLVQPQPTVEPITLEGPLAAAFLVSPWVTNRTTDASFKENSGVDMISAWIVTKSTRDLLGSDVAEGRLTNSQRNAFALETEPSYIQQLSSAVSQIYVTAGNHEIFRDQVVAYVDRLRRLSRGVEVRFDFQQTAAHDFVLLEGQRNEDGEYTRAMREWTKTILLADHKQ